MNAHEQTAVVLFNLGGPGDLAAVVVTGVRAARARRSRVLRVSPEDMDVTVQAGVVEVREVLGQMLALEGVTILVDPARLHDEVPETLGRATATWTGMASSSSLERMQPVTPRRGTPDAVSLCVARTLGLPAFDGVLAFGEALRQRYLSLGWADRVWTWHEAADTDLFNHWANHLRPLHLPAVVAERDGLRE